jgi:hypothetical protein
MSQLFELDESQLRPIRKENKFGYCTPDSKIVIECKYDRVHRKFSEGLAAVNFDGNYGFINKAGETVIPFIYDNAHNFSEGLALVTINWNQVGFINKSGELVIPFIYESHSRDFSEGLAAVSFNCKYGFINSKGETVIPFQYNGAWRFINGLAKVLQNKQRCEIDKLGVKHTWVKIDWNILMALKSFASNQ